MPQAEPVKAGTVEDEVGTEVEVVALGKSMLAYGCRPEDFLWATGIEDTFVAQEAPGQRRLDLYELQQHYHNWRQDLDLAGELGVRVMRYGVPWYKVNPAPGRFDWTWTDRVLTYLLEVKGIEPIVDLVHYGCPLWLKDEFMNPRYPEAVAEWARAFARRYRGLGVRYYTPLNEPFVNAEFCGTIGRWPPYLQGDAGFVRVSNQLCKGIVRTVEVLKDVDPGNILVHVEATGVELPLSEGVRPRAELDNLRRYTMVELVQGRVAEGHFLYAYLKGNGMTAADLAWFRERRISVDVLGINYYPEMCVRERFQEPPEAGGAERLRAIWGGGRYLQQIVRDYWRRYRRPVFITETSTNAKSGDRQAWLEESVAAVRQLRSEGIPVIGYTWWPLYDLINWDYREGEGPVAQYIEPMGLWSLEPDAAGELHRVPTPVRDLYVRMVATSPVGWIGGQEQKHA